MTADTSGPGPTGAGNGPIDNGVYLQLNESPEFKRLRHAFRRFVFPMTAAFLIWYLLYVVLSAYARDFMGTKVIGEINVALIFGLLQFLSTFLIAWAYERYASRTLEPMADAVRAIAPAPVLAGGGPAEPAPVAEPVEEPVVEEAPAEEPGDETAREEGAASETKADAGKRDAAKPDASKSDAAKPDAAKPDAAKPDAAKPEEEEGK